MNDGVKYEYFEWLNTIIFGRERVKKNKFSKLMNCLFLTNFYWIDDVGVSMDENRYKDGVELRGQFIDECGEYDINFLEYCQGVPCSVLEMMVALSLRMEGIMEEPDNNDHTGYWFWHMIENLGLDNMDNYHFDKDFVESKLNIFLDRKYAYDGQGGLFSVDNCKYDLRDVEIWYQMCWYLDSISDL